MIVSETSPPLFFLRYCLDVSSELPEIANKIDWMDLMTWSERQAIVGIIYQGIQRAGKALNIPFDNLMRWVGYALQIEMQNRLVNKRCVELTEEMEHDGFRTCILKGQGVALLYPNPLLRVPGDIDLWLEGGRDKIMAYVTGKYGRLLERYHHVELPNEIDSVSVEVHFTPSYMFSWRNNKRMQEWFCKQSDANLCKTVRLTDSDGMVVIPTNEFNLIFLLSHIFRHLFSEGIGLRQVIDYYYLLKSRAEAQVEKDGIASCWPIEIEKTLRWLGLWKFAGALMWVLHNRLGLEERYLIAEPSDKEGRFLWKEIMIGGNFGQYDTRLGKKYNESRLSKYLRLTVRNMRLVRHYPTEALCEPIFRAWYFLWRNNHGLK